MLSIFYNWCGGHYLFSGTSPCPSTKMLGSFASCCYSGGWCWGSFTRYLDNVEKVVHLIIAPTSRLVRKHTCMICMFLSVFPKQQVTTHVFVASWAWDLSVEKRLAVGWRWFLWRMILSKRSHHQSLPVPSGVKCGECKDKQLQNGWWITWLPLAISRW